ncbi:thermonuclease family protein [Streptomyces sp. NPDC004059]
MPMLLIKGVYKITGASPDGDSVRFYPRDPGEWDLLRGRRVHRNNTGGAQLRLDGIDTLETHYRPHHGPELHQPPPFAGAAAEELLTWLRFEDVQRDDQGIVTSCKQDSQPGYILTRNADVYGRCVALAGRGDSDLGNSGSWVDVDVAALKQTVNYHQLTEGLAYPTFYRNLFVDLREAMADAAVRARTAEKGLWQVDKTESGVKIDDLSSLTDSSVVMPKLFRRLADYLILNDGDPSLAGFPAYLEQRDDRLFIISSGQSTGFGTVVEATNGNTVKLTHHPEDLVFDEK